jgi:hypothetical protein
MVNAAWSAIDPHCGRLSAQSALPPLCGLGISSITTCFFSQAAAGSEHQLRPSSCMVLPVPSWASSYVPRFLQSFTLVFRRVS